MKDLRKRQMMLFGALMKSSSKKDITGLETIALAWNLDWNTRIKALETIRSIGGEAAKNALQRIVNKSDDSIGVKAKKMLDKMDRKEKKTPTGEVDPILEGALS
jgi:hypothetical protein